MELLSQPEDPDPLPAFTRRDIPALEAYISSEQEKLAGWQDYAIALDSEICRFCNDDCLCVKSEEVIAAEHIARHELQLRMAQITLRSLGSVY